MCCNGHVFDYFASDRGSLHYWVDENLHYHECWYRDLRTIPQDVEMAPAPAGFEVSLTGPRTFSVMRRTIPVEAVLEATESNEPTPPLPRKYCSNCDFWTPLSGKANPNLSVWGHCEYLHVEPDATLGQRISGHLPKGEEKPIATHKTFYCAHHARY